VILSLAPRPSPPSKSVILTNDLFFVIPQTTCLLEYKNPTRTHRTKTLCRRRLWFLCTKNSQGYCY
jgi:hypothetical protein